MSRVRGLAALAAAGVAGLLVLAPSAASALQRSAIEFADPTPITAEFGTNWHAKLMVTFAGGEVVLPAPPAQGTVDLYVDGVPGAWATGLPIAPDGAVYATQPLAQPLLGAGVHSLSAVFVPAATGFLETSQTTMPLTLTITPLAVAGAIEVVTEGDPSLPVIRASLAGEYVESHGGSPAGTWSFAVRDGAGEPVFEAERPVRQGDDEPLGVEIAAKLKPGATYTVSGTFEPVAELAPGLTVGEIDEVAYTEGAAPGAGSITLPVWAVIALGVAMLGLAIVAVVLALRLRPVTDATPATTDQETP